MVDQIVVVADEKRVLRDQESLAYNAVGQRLDDVGNVIPYEIVVAEKVKAVRQRTLGDYNMHDQFYAKRSAIRPP